MINGTEMVMRVRTKNIGKDVGVKQLLMAHEFGNC